MARRVEVPRQSVSRWAKRISDEGQTALKAAPLGCPSQLDEAAYGELVQLLKQGELTDGFSTELRALPRVRLLIAQHFTVQHCEARCRGCSGVWVICQRPAGKALQRIEQAIRQWKVKRWPALKKTPKIRSNYCLRQRIGIEQAAYM